MSGTLNFLRGVREAVFSNPFSERRASIDAELTNLAPEDPAVLSALNTRLSSELDRASATMPNIDREVLEAAILFEAFHRFEEELDALIVAEANSESAVPFRAAPEILAFLDYRGFDPARRTRALELFYQLRRAFHFIRTSLVGVSPSMRKLREALWNQVFTRDIRIYEAHLVGRMEDFSTLLVGATGAGKGAAAAAIGRSGYIPFEKDRFARPYASAFLAVNLAEIPSSLLEATLFGHEKGAYTGAIRKSEGWLARVPRYGSIFLDEIGELSLSAQVRLLRVLQDREFTPLGAERKERFEGRVIAATHQEIDVLRAEGHFREDLYYRLATEVIQVPSLRRRIQEDKDELPLLAEAILRRLLPDGADALLEPVLQALSRDIPRGYGWPGNVRELEQSIRRILLTGSCAPAEAPSDHERFWRRAQALELRDDELRRGYLRSLYEKHRSYVKVAEQAGIDRRTAKRFISQGPPEE